MPIDRGPPLFHPRTRADFWRTRLRLLEDSPSPSLSLYLPSLTRIATGYVRVVIGARGPYVEFLAGHLRLHRLYLPRASRWRQTSGVAFYEEYRTRPDRVMVYHQLRPVAYADYRVNRYYISPFDLRDRRGRCIISGTPPPEKQE